MSFGSILKVAGKGVWNWVKKNPDKIYTAAEMGYQVHEEKKERKRQEAEQAEERMFNMNFAEDMQTINNRMIDLESAIVETQNELDDFQLMIMDEAKGLSDDISVLRSDFEKAKAIHKRKFIIQTVLLSIGTIAAIVLSLLL